MAINGYYEQKLEIDLSKQEGNVFHLLGIASQLAKDLEISFSEISKEMIAGDYGNAIAVFDREFGHLIDLKLPKNMQVEKVKDSYKNRKNKELAASMTAEKIHEVYTR